jgi:hypothetical protein
MPLQVHRFRFPPAGKKQDSIKSATSDGITGSKTDLKGKSMRGERASSSTKDEKESRVLDRNWVNVKEQLPAEDHIVLVYDPQLLVGVAIAVFDGKNFFQFQEKTSPCS